MTLSTKQKPVELDPDSRTFYRSVLHVLETAQVAALVGGAYAFAIYTGIERQTKDLDIFVRPRDYERATRALTAAGYQTELTFPHWLGKAYSGAHFVDIIFDSGNGATPVDDAWFDHAVPAEVLDMQTRIVPLEEMIWSKAFIMERERYDGADVAHMLLHCAQTLDWRRLLERMGPHWRVLLSHVTLFGFIYPGERERVPAWLLDELMDRLRAETHSPAPGPRVCRGTLLSREQYLFDVNQQGFADARLPPFGRMRPEDVAIWTAAIED